MKNTKRRATDPNHKARFLYAVRCVCSCGWESGHHYGKGAQGQASGEWHSHRDKCDKANAIAYDDVPTYSRGQIMAKHGG